ncbi:hypothetical protein [Streptosporangium sp. NPDC051022]|uniref:hypothetical protein n=1 Tax=Streptosporangium sp. NPDC051022 TaxID=3155752 RepID=UPI0034479316
MSHTEHDLRELLASRGQEGGGGGSARLDEIIARGRRIRRRRWTAAAALAVAVTAGAVMAPPLLSGGRDAKSVTAAQVGRAEGAARGEGVRLAGARSESTGKVERLSFTPKSDRTLYRVDCAADSRVFLRFGDRVDAGRCGTDSKGSHWNTAGDLKGTSPGVPVTVEVFTVPASQVPRDLRDRGDDGFSSADFDRVLAASEPGAALWEVAIHDGGVSTRSCSPDICLSSGTRFATQGERNLAGLPNGHQVEGGHLTRINERFTFRAELNGGARVYVRCAREDLHAFIWAGRADGDGVLAKSLPCGAKPARWEFHANGPTEVTVAVVRRDRVPGGADFTSDLQAASKSARRLLGTLRPEAGNWDVSIQQWDEPADKVSVSEGPDGPVYTFKD